MLVIGGSTGRSLAQALAKELGGVLGAVETKRFPDGEAYVRVDADVQGEDVVVVHRPRPDDALVEGLLLGDAVRRLEPARVTLAVPYLPYARQDRVFEPGEALSVQVVADALARHADAVAVLDPHEDDVVDRFPVPAAGVTAVPEIAHHVADAGVDLVLAPDAGARPDAEAAADRLGADADHLEKTRLSASEVRIQPKRLDADGRTVLVLDDIISTGGTMSRAVAALVADGAHRVLAACVHGLFADDALDRLRSAGCHRVVATDSLPNPVDAVSVAPALARGVRRLSA